MATIISTYKLTICKENVEVVNPITQQLGDTSRITIIDEIPFGQEVKSNIISENLKKYDYSLSGLTLLPDEEKAMLSIVNCNYNLEMFNPGHLTIELSLKRMPSSGSVLPATWRYTSEDVQKSFLGTKVRLEYSYVDSNGATKVSRVASDFFVYDVNTVMSSSDQNSMSVILDVYSMDKLLDLQPMTKAYTAKKLSEIIDGQINEVNAEFAKKSNSFSKLSIEKLGKFNLLSYTLEYMKSVTNTTTGVVSSVPAKKETELIFPYLVQYNETFYSFIRRVCARSGEFLYWADGAMQCGLTPSAPVNIADNDNGYKSVRTKANKSEFNVFKVNDWHRSAFVKKDPKEKKDVFPTDKYVNEGQLGNDDFLKELDEKKKPNQMIPDLFSTPRLGAAFTKFGKSFATADDGLFKWIIKLLRHVASGSDTADVIKKIVVETGWSTPFGASQVARSIEIGGYNANNLPINKNLKALYPNYEKQFNSEEQKAQVTDKEGKVKDVLSHFGTAGSFAKKATLGQLTEAVHAKIKAAATEAASKELIIDLDNYGTELRLGSVVTIPNQGIEQYIITHISGTFTHGNDNRLQCHRVAHAMPMAKYSDTKSLWLPAPIENDVVKAQGPMTGFVTETADPYGQGRVRVRMSWQNTSAMDATPWIRMAMPMAGKSGSLHVQPGIGDEVLVDFENGNMERPYVRGSLFNGDQMMMYSTQPSKTDAPGTLARAFQTGKGSGLFIDDEKFGVADWVKMISPKMGHILSNVPVDLSGAKSLPVGAKIEMRDFFGFYSVSMSSKDRKVSIASPLGNISLSAFTGISISAPNGDISISGKNVTIKAGDRLSLSSGGNIKKPSNLNKGGWVANVLAELIKTAANTILGPKALDLSLIRQFVDVFARPMNGTLQLHSNRHLVLEAGKGKAEIPYDSIKADARNKVKNAVNGGYPYFLIRQLYETVQDINDKHSKMLIDSYNAIVDFKAKYTRPTINELDNDNPKFETYLHYRTTVEILTTTLSMDKCKQIFELVQKEGDTWVYGGDEDSKMKLCPIPKVIRDHVRNVIGNWRAKVNEFGLLVCNYWNALDDLRYGIGKAFDAIINLKKDGLTDSSADKALKNIKAKLDNYLKGFEVGTSVGVGKVEKLAVLNADTFLEGLKHAQFVTIKEHIPSQQVTFIFIKCLLDAKIISYVGDQEKQPDGTYENNIPVESDNYYDFIGEGKKEENWKVFTSRLVPYFKDIEERGETGFFGELKEQAKSFGKKQVDVDLGNIEALNRIVSHKERDMWDASSNPGSILLSAGKGAKTTRLEASGDFKSHANPSVKMLIETFQKAHEEPVKEEPIDFQPLI